MIKQFRNLFSLALVYGLVTLLGVTLLSGDYSHIGNINAGLQNFLYNDANTHTGDVTVVAIDPKSLASKADGGLGRWQNWRRSYYGQVIENLNEAGASVIGIDVFFSEPSGELLAEDLRSIAEDPELDIILTEEQIQDLAEEDDRLLKEALDEAGNVILAAKLGATLQDTLLPLPSLYDPSTTELASIEFFQDLDNVVRQIPFFTSDTSIPLSFSAKLVLRHLGLEISDINVQDDLVTLLENKTKYPELGKNFGPIAINLQENGRFYNRFFGTPYTVPTLSFADVYYGTFDAELVENRIVLIGEMDSGLKDEVFTPVSKGVPMPGVELHANAITSMLRGLSLNPSSPITQSVILSFVLLCCAVLFSRYRLRVGMVVALLFIPVYYYIAARLFWNNGILVDLVIPPLTVFLLYLAVTLTRYLLKEREKEFAVAAFSRYVSKDVVDSIIKADSDLALGGEKRHMVVAFTDIAHFTSLSEKLSAEELVAFLHEYLSLATSIIQRHEGTVDKYIGDAIMYFWNAPLLTEKYQEKACACVLELHEATDAFFARKEKEFGIKGLGIRTGLAGGEMTVGNFGSETRFDYTVIGDVVNLASRIEGANKLYGTSISVNKDIAESVYETFALRPLDRLKVKGKDEMTELFELRCHQSKLTESVKSLLEDFDQALAMYYDRDFGGAAKAFEKLSNSAKDSPSSLYHERSMTFLKKAPPRDWEGEYIMTSK